MKKSTQWRLAVAVAALSFLALHQLRKTGEPTKPEAASTAPVPVRLADGGMRLGRLVFSPCELKAPLTGATSAALCAPFSVPEDWDQPDGRKIDLKLALIASNAAAPPADPLVLLAGGPGQAATEVWAQERGAFAPMSEHRNVLLLDQRGTGGSNALTCKLEDSGDSEAFDIERVRRNTGICLEQVKKHADPRYYTTSFALRDLEAVREAIGAPRLNLIGVSYGTRVAQQYAKSYPDAVRSIILDSAVPNDNALGSDFAANLDESLKAQFALCTANTACAKAFGDPWANLQKLRGVLRAQPVEASYRDPVSNALETMKVGEDSLAGLARMYAYMPEMSALLPLGISRAVAGDYAGLAGQTHMLGLQLKSLTDNAMQLSVICAEDADRLSLKPADTDTLLGTRFVEVILAQCALWPHGKRPADFNAPLTGDVPVLLLAGQFDPVTPPRYAQAIARQLPNSRVLLANGQGHSVLGRGCFPKLAARFVDTRDALALEADCVKNFSPVPAFIDFSGAAP